MSCLLAVRTCCHLLENISGCNLYWDKSTLNTPNSQVFPFDDALARRSSFHSMRMSTENTTIWSKKIIKLTKKLKLLKWKLNYFRPGIFKAWYKKLKKINKTLNISCTRNWKRVVNIPSKLWIFQYFTRFSVSEHVYQQWFLFHYNHPINLRVYKFIYH